MYRVLGQHTLVAERRRLARHPAKVCPELVATAPQQVYSWDITKLAGPVKGTYFDAYVMIDIYSRYLVGVHVHAHESGVLARELMDRQPAAFCGIVGMKPTYGRVSRYGVIAFASSMDQVGPMTKNVREFALLLETISGHDPADSTSIRLPVPSYSQLLTGEIVGYVWVFPRNISPRDYSRPLMRLL